MTITLQEWAGRPFKKLPRKYDDDGVTFTGADFDALPDELKCTELVLKRSVHIYDNFPADSVYWFGEKDVLSALGLSILAGLFQNKSFKINLSNSHSEIKVIWSETYENIILPNNPDVAVDLKHYMFWPTNWTENPHRRLLDMNLAPYSYPQFNFTNSEDIVIHEKDFKACDHVKGFGSLEGRLNFAILLIELGMPECEINEFNLEIEGGFRGVAPMSIEARINLPGSFAWEEKFWDPACQQGEAGE